MTFFGQFMYNQDAVDRAVQLITSAQLDLKVQTFEWKDMDQCIAAEGFKGFTQAQ